MTNLEVGSGKPTSNALIWTVLVAGLVLVAVAVLMLPVSGLTSATADAPAVAAQPAVVPVPVEAVVSGPPAPAPINLDTISRIAAVLAPRQRNELLADGKAFAQFVAEESARRSVVMAARVNDLHNNERIALLMRRGANRALLESFIGLKTNETIAAGFPSPEQVAKFYADNPRRHCQTKVE